MFVFDEDGWLTVLDEDVPTDHLEMVDVERGEFNAFDIDGQILDITQNYSPRVRGRDVYDFCPTGEYDLGRLTLLVHRAAALSRCTLGTDDPLIEMANWGLKPRQRRWLSRMMRRPVQPPPELYSR